MDSSEENQEIEEHTLQYLWNISRKTSLSCPAASRYYVFNLKKSSDIASINFKGIKENQFCKHCGSLWSPTNHKVRIKPPAKKNNHIKKLLKWEDEQPWKLNNRQRKKLLKYRESSNKIVYTCLCCKKTTEHPGFKRKLLTKEKITSLYQLPLKIKPKRRDLNAGLLINSSKKNILPSTQEKDRNDDGIADHNITITNKETCSFSSKEPKFISNQLSHTTKNNSAKIISQNVNNSTPNFPKNKKKKSLLAQILKQEQEAGKKKSSLSSFLISI